jgi:hypothetical protein
MTNHGLKRSFLRNGGVAVAALALAACAMQRPPMERILQEGDCASVPDIEHLAITVSDHGAKVAFRWSGQRFAGTVQTSTDPLGRDASYGENRAGEWERRFPGTPAAGAIPNAHLGFPASANPGAGVLAASVYDNPHPGPAAVNRAVAVVDLKTSGTVLLPATRRVGSIAVSPKGDYVAVVEVASATTASSWRDWFGLQTSAQAPRFDLYATVYSTGGLVACTRELATGIPSPVVNVAWRA